MSNARTAAVLRDARDLITERGWTAVWPRKTHALSIRSAIILAADGNSATYCDAVNAWRDIVKDGVMSWEFGTHADPPRRRTQEEVVKMLNKVIRRLESR